MSNAGEDSSTKSIRQLTGSLGPLRTQIKKIEKANKPVPPELLSKKADLKKQIADYNKGKGKLADQSKGKASGKGKAPDLGIAGWVMESKETKDEPEDLNKFLAIDSGIESSTVAS